MIEMPEGTAGATRESTGRNAGRVFRRTIQELAILDEEPLQATCAYIDLNPVAAGIVDVPEASPHTSITERVEHVKAQGRTGDLKAAGKGRGCETPISQRSEWPEHCVWNPFAIKTCWNLRV
jgi:hypothetical protein